MEGNSSAILLRDLLNVLLVLPAHHDVGYAGTLRRKDLLLDAPYRQDLSTESDLSRHSRVLSHLSLRYRRGDRRGDSDACRGTILRRSPFGHMDVYVPLLENPIVDAQRVGMRLHIFQGYDGTLLHHVSEITRQRELAALSSRQRSLYEEDFSSDACPGKSRDHSGIVVALVDIPIERLLPEQSLELVGSYAMVLQLSVESLLVRHLPQSLVYLLLELSDATLTGVVLYDLLQSLLRERYFRCDAVEPVVCQFLRYEVMPCDLHLLLRDISAELNYLHSVEQRSWYGVQVVCRGNEHNVREVIVEVEVVVVEGIVLLRVEHLEQCRRRVSVDGCLRYLVDFVEDEHRIAGARLLYALYDTSRHGTDVSPAVSAYLRLVVQSSERYAHILSLQRLGDALSERSLSHSRWPVEAEYGAFEIAL